MKLITPAARLPPFIRLIPFILLILAVQCAPAMAQAAWTFDQVLQAALATHPALLGKRSGQAAAQADLEGAKWQRYPTASIERALPANSASSALVRIEQPLWTGGRISAGIDAAGGRLAAAGAALDEEALNVSLRVIAAHAEAQRQKARQEHASEGVAQHEKLLAMIRRRVAQEVSSHTDQRLAESRMYQALNEQSGASQALANALMQLTQLAGSPVAQIAGFALRPGGAAPALEAAVAQALAYSPTLRRLEHEQAAAQADIAARRSAYLPQLVLRLEKSTGQINDSRAMLVLLAQPGAGLSALAGVSGAVARLEALRMAAEGAQRDTRERLTLDWNEWTAARLRLENAGLASDMSGEVFDSYTRQYVIGRKSWNDVLNAVRELTQSQFALEDARAQASAAALRLGAQCGTLKQLVRTTP